MIYFYHVGAYGYEVRISKEYYSYANYTQEEFEEILFKVFNTLMNKILQETPSSICYHNIYFNPDDLILEEKFDKLMNEQGFHPVASQLNATVDFTLNMTGNKYHHKLDDLFLKLPIDESCKEKNCNRILDLNSEDREWCKKHCGVILREKLRKNRGIDDGDLVK